MMSWPLEESGVHLFGSPGPGLREKKKKTDLINYKESQNQTNNVAAVVVYVSHLTLFFLSYTHIKQDRKIHYKLVTMAANTHIVFS